VSLSCDGQQLEKSKKSNASYYGDYVPYKWEAEEISEVSENQANRLLRGRMHIKADVFSLFDDTVYTPRYEKFGLGIFFNDHPLREDTRQMLLQVQMIRWRG
jgi:hypothetical protein